MNRVLRIAQVVLGALLLATFTAVATHGKPEYTKKEKTACTTCHVKSGSKELNDVGKCYEKKKSLDACKVPEKK